MTREEQDKLWAELSEEKQKEYKEKYNSYLTSVKTETHSSNYEWGIKEGEVKILIDTFGEHNIQPTLTYEDVARELFEDGYYYYENEWEGIGEADTNLTMPMACISDRQVKKLCAINKLLNVAKFLNKNEDGSDWVPDWENAHEAKYYPLIDEDGLRSGFTEIVNRSLVYFRSYILFEKAVAILGEDVFKTALTTEY